MSGRFRCARCDWQSEDPDATAGHAELHPRCVICGQSLKDDELRVDVACLGSVKRDLMEIVDLYATAPDFLGHIGSNAPRRDARSHGDGSERLPGGDALVMLAGGSEGRSEDITTWEPNSVPAVAYELGKWEDAFRRERREPAAPGPATVTTVYAYLSPRIGWAAGYFNPGGDGFAEFATEVRAIRAALVRVTGTSTAPETREARCINLDCSGCDTVKLERGYGDDGRADYWSCPRCRRQYGQHGYHLALAATLARRGVVA